MKVLMTLGLLLENDKALLGMKKRGFGAGRWNGFGGKVKPGETIDEAFVRECREECGIEVLGYEKVGVMEFSFQGNPDIFEVHHYRILKYNGVPAETDEMKPQWFALKEIPYESMWPDDSYWMPMFLDGRKFVGQFHFENKDKILSHILKEVDSV